MTVHMRPSQIAFWPLDRLKPYVRNAKTHAQLRAAQAVRMLAVTCGIRLDRFDARSPGRLPSYW